MAVDNEAKRRAVQSMTFGLMRGQANNNITSGDRATAAWIYSISGNASSPITGHARVAFVPIWMRGTT